jgi:hypothetical protein
VSPAIFGWELGDRREDPFAHRRYRNLGGWVAELVAVAANQGLPVWHMVGTFYLGWIKVKNNEVAEGMSLLRTGLGAYSITRGGGVEAPKGEHPGG